MPISEVKVRPCDRYVYTVTVSHLHIWQDHQRCSRTSIAAIPAEALASIADSGDKDLRIDFDNVSDPECTIVNIQGSDQSNLLIRLSGAFSSAGVEVVGATITSDDGRILDVFKVQMQGKKVSHIECYCMEPCTHVSTGNCL